MNKLYLLVLTVFLLTACTKDVVEEGSAMTTGSYSRSFFFPRTSTTESVVSNITPPIVLAASYNNTGSLSIGLEVGLPSGTDAVGLVIKKDRLKNGLVGEYVISPFLTPGKPAGDVDLTYGYSRNPPATLFFLPGGSDGVLKITAYNEKVGSINGVFSFRINADKDPRSANQTLWENTQIDVSGSFADVKITR